MLSFFSRDIVYMSVDIDVIRSDNIRSDNKDRLRTIRLEGLIYFISSSTARLVHAGIVSLF